MKTSLKSLFFQYKLFSSNYDFIFWFHALYYELLLGLVGAPACGDVMKLQFETDENGLIIDAKFKTFGCGSAIGKLSISAALSSIIIFISYPGLVILFLASSSVATEWLIGKTVEECTSIKVLY
jgi:nitrogen fixation protein NifU and related proteins